MEQVIFGAKVPVGRLIQTVYPESYAAEVSIFGARTGYSSLRSSAQEGPLSQF